MKVRLRAKRYGETSTKLEERSRAWRVIAAVLVMALVGGVAVFGVPDLSPKLNEIPTTRPTRGDVDVRVYTIGELGPRRSMMLAAPTAGTLLQIIKLATSGTVVKEGDVVIEFDRAAEQYNLQQAESELAEADQELVKMQADAKVQAAQDQLNLLHARHDLRRAEIKVSGNEFVGAIEAKKNTLELDEKTRALAQLELDIKTHLAGNKAALAATQEKRAKSQIAADFARKSIESLTVRAPLNGLAVIKENQDAGGNFGFMGMTLPEYRVGDTVQPGRSVAEIVDLTEIEIKTKISETERSSITSGAPANVQVEALPGPPMSGASKGVGSPAQKAFWEPETSRQFNAAFALARPSSALRPGMTARVAVQGPTLKNVIHLPRQVLFEKDGKPVVYVREGTRFKAVPVQVASMTETRVVLRDFATDVDVALVNPDAALSGGPGSTMGAAMPGARR
jgi:HlyD family secretion protein